MNVKGLFYKWMLILLMVIGIFAIGSTNVFADSFDSNQGEESQIYTISNYRAAISPGYNKVDFYNKDILCSSSTASSWLDNGKDAEAAKCNNTQDDTIHVYPVWQILEGAQPFSKDVKAEHSSFSQMTYLFEVAGSGGYARWRTLSNEDADGNNVLDTGSWSLDRGIYYVMVYLHRMTKGFDLYQNFRVQDVYTGEGNSNLDNVSSSSPAYFLTNNNGAFQVSNALLYYSTVPHVLGTEGLLGNGQGGSGKGDKMVIAIMDETTGRPVPVYKDSGYTGFSSVKTNFADGVNIAEELQRLFPYNGNSDDGRGYTKMYEVANDNVQKEYEHVPFMFYFADKNGVTQLPEDISIRGGLNDAITAMGGPQYIATVDIALSEAITQRNSAYAFMSAYGTNGANYNTGWGNNTGSNTNPEQHYGQYNLSPRTVYYYLNGNASINPRTSNREIAMDIIKIRLRPESEMTNKSAYQVIATSAAENPNAINRNFKHSFTSFTRGACYSIDGKTCYQRVMFNYFNDVEETTIKVNGKEYRAYRLIPNTATCGSSRVCSVKENNGFSTFYFSGSMGVTTNSIQNYTDTSSKNDNRLMVNKGKYQYSDQGNAWGVWRQVGWSTSLKEIGGAFAKDTAHFPKTPQEVDNDYSESATICRFAWSEDYYYNNETEYNTSFLQAYMDVSNGNVASGYDAYVGYNEMIDVYLNMLRTAPDMIFRTFDFTTQIANKQAKSAEPYPGGADKNSDEERFITKVNNFGVGKANYNKIAAKLCENFGWKCTTVAGFKEQAAIKENRLAIIGEGNNKSNFATSYLAIVDAMQTKDEYNITYGEHMAYAFYNFYVLIGLPDEYTVGQLFAARNNGRNYGFTDILLADRSNIIMLNEETRLNTPATGRVDNDKNAIGTDLNGLKSGITMDDGRVTTGEFSLGTKYGPELYLLNEIEGSIWTPGQGDGNEPTCPSGYKQEGEQCIAEHSMSYNRSCKTGYAFDFNQFKCVEIGTGVVMCPDGYELEGNVCTAYGDSVPICEDGYWDPDKRVCIEYSNSSCPTGYKLQDATESDKLLATKTYSFARGNGEFGLFTSSGVTNFRQDSDSTISYDLSSSNGYIQITGLNIDPTKVNLIQVKMKNASIGSVGRIYYTTTDSVEFNNVKSVSFDVEPDSDANYYIYTVNMSGGMWNSTVTGLRFQLSDVNKGSITIDNISYGKTDPDYTPTYKCVKDLTPVCPNGFTLYKGRCYGYASDLVTIPSTYELDCSHVVPKENEKVTLASFRVGDYVNFEHGTSASVFTVPADGTYYLELWGASNGTGKGGYTAGMADLKEGDIIYVYTGIQNGARATTIYKGGLGYDKILATATSSIAGTNNLKNVSGIAKITKAGTEWFKKPSEIGNTSWSGEMGHSGNGYARITLYSAAGITATSGSKTAKVSNTKTYTYTGSAQTITLGAGTHVVELYGASGGDNGQGNAGSKGTYVKGELTYSSQTTAYLYIGGQGKVGNNAAGGWNGGGKAGGCDCGSGSGGGATDIRVGGTALANRVIVAGGGGGAGDPGSPGQTTCKTYGTLGTGDYGHTSNDGGGGGGGYYGGYTGHTVDAGGYIGSSYVNGTEYKSDTSSGTVVVTHNNNLGNGYAKITSKDLSVNLGYYINQNENSKELGACLLHDKSVNLDDRSGLELYVDNGYINKCGVGATCEEVSRTEKVYFTEEFGYTGAVQSVTLDPGTYTLEVWGAQGGTLNQNGGQSTGSGRGGYSTGTITLSARTTLYIGVGGQGKGIMSGKAEGGWNGGGAAYGAGSSEPGNGGGGATHIALASGTLSSLSGNKGSVLIVAGGGGGMGEDDETGGYGGGTSGGNGNSSAGTQSSGYAFGQGASCYNGGASGGGYYGGYSTYNAYSASGSDCNAGSGGSGYVNTSRMAGSTYAGNQSFANTAGTGNETGHAGNGYAKITGYTTITKTYEVCTDGTITEIEKEPEEIETPAVPFHQDFGYTGSVQTVTLQPGTYTLETWGASGGAYDSSLGGKGGYSTGTITLTQPTILYIYVGGQGTYSSSGSGDNGSGGVWANGGFNGGGDSGHGGYKAGSGGGASDIRIGTDSLYSRVIVAGGGGGMGNNVGTPGYGGGTTGGTTANNYSGRAGGTPGTQTSAGSSGASFGKGGYLNENHAGGGGGGWYGGGAGQANSSCGAGGSGYVYTAGTASSYPSGCTLNGSYYLTNAQTIAGNQSFISPNGGTETGHTGNGYVRITGMIGGSNSNGSTYIPTSMGYSYTGGVQTVTLQPGTYKLEAWGAQGGNATYSGSYSTEGGKGGYSYGIINVSTPTTYYLYVGGQGTSSTSTSPSQKPGGFNGGGYSMGGDGSYVSAAGGGATHIATVSGTLNTLSGNKGSIVLVAGGGGGAGTSSNYPYATGGAGGGTSGAAGTNVYSGYTGGGGGSQSSGGTKGSNSSYSSAGSFGQGGNQTASSGGWSGGGGGGGYYGGGSGGAVNAAGGGGSGYVNTSVLTSAQTIAGNQSFASPYGGAESGHSGNGYIKITNLSEVENNGGNAITQQVTDFYYTGYGQQVTLEPGVYQLETWGAQGGDYLGSGYSYNYAGGKGGYSVGTITISQPTTVYVYVGGKGGYSTSCGTAGAGGFNGGGSTGTCGGSNSYAYGAGGGGGGATDIRIGTDSLYSRVIVAGGGGGSFSGSNSSYSNSYVTNPSGHNYQGGYGGGTTAGGGGSWCAVGGNGGGQTGTNRVTNSCSNGSAAAAGTFGYGSSSTYSSYLTGTGGGGGWYGGQAGGSGCGSATGGGGSGYVYTASTASYYPAGCTLNSSYYLTNAQNIAGNQAFVSPTGGYETGHSGNGHARITVLSTTGTNLWNGMSDNISYVTTNGPINGDNFATSRDIPTTYWAGDVLVGEKYLYVVSPYLSRVEVRNRNGDGTMGSVVATNLNWYSADTYTQYIHSSGSSNPTAYTTYYKDGVTKLIGWSRNSSVIYEWTISDSTHLPTSRVEYSAPRTFGNYGRAAWDGENTIYFVDGEGNGSSEEVYKFDITTKSISLVTTLKSEYDYYNYSSSAAYIDRINNHIYLSDAANRDNSFGIVVFDLVNGNLVKVISDAAIYTTLKINGSNYTSVAYKIDPTHPTLGWAMTSSYAGVTEFYVSNNNVATTSPTYIEENSTTYGYTGDVQTVTLQPGTYKFEAWGAQGGNGYSSTSYIGYGGKGGYSAGFMTFDEPTTVYLYVGGQGKVGTSNTSYAGGWNGGGNGYYYSGGGGGASDIRIGGTAYGNRVIVAGGGGGGHAYSSYPANGGAGGGYNGGNGYSSRTASYYVLGATQGNAGYASNNTAFTGGFGVGANYYSTSYYSGGGGGGWYGGGAGYYDYLSGSGGSGYVGGVINGYMFDGNITFAGVDGAYETGHSGDGAIKISKIKSIAANSGICSMEARLKIIPTCSNGVEFDINTNKCTLRQDPGCNNGEIYHPDMNKCEYNIPPVGCTNGGISVKIDNKYYCRTEATPQCQDVGYSFVNGVCEKDVKDSYQNELCIAPYFFQIKDGRALCTYKEVRDINDFVDATLSEQLNVVEVGKVYRYRNYVGYKATSGRGIKYVNNGLYYTNTSYFPSIEVTFTLVAPDKATYALNGGKAEIKSTENCRVGNTDHGTGACELLDEKTYETYTVTIPVKVTDVDGNTKLVNGGLQTVFAGNRIGGKMQSTYPDSSSLLETPDKGVVNASQYLWSMWKGIDTGFVLDSDFATIWSAVDVYFQFKEDSFCFANASGDELVNFAEESVCVPYSYEAGQDKFIVVDNGVNKLNLETDAEGDSVINNIIISSVVGAPNSFVDNKVKEVDNKVVMTNAYLDNTRFTDDRSDFISAFKVAPEGDIFIDRFEVINATTNEVVLAAEAMTEWRCKNGYALNTGAGARFTQTTIANYDNGQPRVQVDADGNIIAGTDNRVMCQAYDPTATVQQLNPENNYIVKVYTQYINLNENDIAMNLPAEVRYISLDIQHLGNTGSKNVLSMYMPSMKDAKLSDKYTIRACKKIPQNVCDAIYHLDIVEFSYAGLITGKPVAPNNTCTFVASGLDSIQRYYTVDNNYMTAVDENVAALIIPANGLLNKGISSGLYNVSVGGELAMANAYTTWDRFPLNYYLGEGPDVETSLVMKCTNIATNKVEELVTKTNACVIINSEKYKDCNLYAVIENTGNKNVEISTNIRAHVATDSKTRLDPTNGELYNADGSSKYFMVDAATYGGEASFPSTAGGSETGHAGHGYARITNIKTGAVQNFAYTGASKNITLEAGTYKLQVWGAQGGSKWGTGGKGGYSVGTVELNKTVDVQVNVGGHPADNSLTGGWNGGGNGQEADNVKVYRSPGGGGTDIRIGGTGLNDRIIVAGGGGGGAKYAVDQRGGPGGGETAHFNYYSTWGTLVEYQSENYGGSQTESCRASVDSYGYTITCSPGSLGTGASGAGGGYYGGGYYSCANRVYSGSGGSGYVRVAATKNKLTAETPKAEVIVRNNVTESTWAAAGHYSADNEGYSDGDLTNNYAEGCWLFDYINYSVSDMTIDTPSKIWVDCDGDGNLKNNGLVEVTFTGSYKIHKEYDAQSSREMNIEYEILRGDGSKFETQSCTYTPQHKTITGAYGTVTKIDYTVKCQVKFLKTDCANDINVKVKVNGGKDGNHTFDESNYEDNEVFATTDIECRDCKIPVCDDTCTQQNEWGINFDYLYHFEREYEAYRTDKLVNMTWKDYSVGTVSGNTEDKEYTGVGGPHVTRAPDDYMAFKSDKLNYAELCTDYKSNNEACWRYEMNVTHNVTYYLWSEAVTSVYTTHKVLKSDNGNGTDDAGECSHVNATFVNGTESYGDYNHGQAGEDHDYANSNNKDRDVNACHGFTEAPNTTACAVATDWWGNKICDKWETTYSASAPGGNHPPDYIPYENFQDYTLEDGAGKSPTTNTDHIVLKNQTQTNLNQGANHAGWVETKTMDVCDLKSFMNISYSCRATFTYGTEDGVYKYAQTNGDEGTGICYSVGHDETTRQCEWTNSSKSPPEAVWWNDSGATCYRQHKDFTCDGYYSFSKVNSTSHNSTGNGESGTCNWRETDSGSSSHSSWGVSDSCSGSCTSSCGSWNTDKYGNKTTCASWNSCTAKCTASDGCTSQTFTNSGVDATVSGSVSSTKYQTCMSWSASDGQTARDCKTSCSGYPGSWSHTFTHSETYSGSGYGNNMHYQCSSGDINTGGFCYETYNDSASLTKSDERCIRWSPREYKEIKYYSTASGDNGANWFSRSYSNPSEVWQYTCKTTEPKVAYPNDKTVYKAYKETITASSYIKTVSSGDQWIKLNADGNTTEAARPRAGEWFELKFVTVYNTTRWEKPSELPLLQQYYNNYHNIPGGLGADNTTVYPTGGYNHYGTTDSEKTAIGDNKTVIADKFSDIVNNEDYGYCTARPQEPYGCSYNAANPNQFMYPKTNDNTTVQGHTGANWTTNQDGKGTCYFGPDNDAVWKKKQFGDNYYTALLICSSSDSKVANCDADGVDEVYISSCLSKTTEKCLSWANGLCVTYEITWESPLRGDSMGNQRRGYYLDEHWDTQKGIIFDLRSSHFNAVGQYEKELLGETVLSSKDNKNFFQQADNPIKPLCVCQTTSSFINKNDYKWGSTEWEVE